MRSLRAGYSAYIMRLASLLVALSVLAASAGIPVGMHLCRGAVADVRLYAAAHSCGMVPDGDRSVEGACLQQVPCCQDLMQLDKAADQETDRVSATDAGAVAAAAVLPSVTVDLAEWWAAPRPLAQVPKPERSAPHPALYELFQVYLN